ncbi:hypothetical protein ACF3DV_16225 [Chlorogloeopsis fritschii PCC 9212]|uniref:Uncharacterized protein n=2 Tax=Chlorogloeopsis fritschii TaxID=1124 RepID=A0A433MXF2_CHLFR|nr:hypothetical protein [Chlorogloeopsis fritschii]RUR72797.1 hypothetical protein PCC6912_60680 [Chlorogloeopsis fritschii PCC 6912]
MPIPQRKVKISLNKTEPTKLTAEILQKQLASIGLTCIYTEKENLSASISEVKSKLPSGVIQTYGIKSYKQSEDGKAFYTNEFDGQFDVGSLSYNGLEKASEANWEPDSSALGYSTELEYIQFPSHFDYLVKNRSSFTGIKYQPTTYTGKFTSVDSIKSLFVNVGTIASASLVKGLDKDSIESVLSNAIAPINDANVQDYDVSDSRVIFLVENYNPETREADAIGVLTINWHLVIKDYKKKKDSLKHDTTLTIWSRSVLYDSIDALNADVEFVQSHFKNNLFLFKIPAKPSTVEIFPSLPPAIKDTFSKSLPKISKEDFVEVIVLYSPDLDNIGSLDNSNSDADTKYSKSVTSGFTFTASQSFSTELSFEASAEVVKAGFKIGFNITFTEQWSESTTETMEFTVPAGKKAFTYQGYLLAAILRYDPANDSYKYVDFSRFMTNILTTTRTPIEAAS